jgi:UDP-GlcNAc:undecaprenyl-phosphate GlcNAc-1-phosphate transferase
MLSLSPVISAFFSQPLWLALIVSLAMVPLLKHPMRFLGLVDYPGGRKQHDSPAVLNGGAAILISFITCLVVFELGSGYAGMIVATACLFLIGLLDDKYDVSPVLRLFLQASIITVALWHDNVWLGDIEVTDSATLDLGVFTYPITVIVILGITNAINMLDGIDGLSAGVALITLAFLTGMATDSGVASLQLICVSLFGAILGFWAFNYRFKWRQNATFFMGDSGTAVLGFLLPYIAIQLSNTPASLASPQILLWMVAIPVWDIITVVVKRLKLGRSPLHAGRDHIHHTLMEAGLEVRQILHLIYLLCIATASAGIVFAYFNLNAIETYIMYAIGLTIYYQRITSLDRKNNQLPEGVVSLDDAKKTEPDNLREINKSR